METVRGRSSRELDLAEWNARLSGHDRVVLDLGTGDGRYVSHLAGAHPRWFVVGVDACRENLRRCSRRGPSNALFVIANARELPRELAACAAGISINFPWGSLLEDLLAGDPRLLRGLESVARPTASIELRLNGGALAEAGLDLEAGASRIREGLLRAGWRVGRPAPMDAAALRRFPSTWARRLAFGRAPRAMALDGRLG